MQYLLGSQSFLLNLIINSPRLGLAISPYTHQKYKEESFEVAVRTTTRGSNGPQSVTQLTNDHPSRVKVMLQ